MTQQARWLSAIAAVAVYSASGSAHAQPAQAAPAETAPAPAAPAETSAAPAETTAPPPAQPAPQPTSDNGWGEAGPTQAPPPAATAPVTTPPAPGPTEEELERKRTLQKKKGLMIGGWTTLGVTYGTALTVGVIAIDTAKGDSDRRRWGRRMAIPIGGPFAAAFVSKTASGTLFTVLTGAAQATGLVLGVVGTVLYTKERSKQRQMAFSVLPNRDGGVNVGASWRF